ncbi:MAG: cytochrome c oxidase assembly protein [Aestuariivirgaceae bacterium]
MAEPTVDQAELSRRHRRVALYCLTFVAAMVGAAYAAVPLYDLFCKTTGFGGTPVTAEKAPDKTLERTFEVRFDSNVNGIPWRFVPEAKSVTVKAGEVKTVYYKIINTDWTATRGIASYNVTPESIAPYFSKIQCFCFSEQTLGPGQQLELPVVFFVDPAIVDDHELDSISTVTLSYTFFPSKEPPKPVANAGSPADKPKL